MKSLNYFFVVGLTPIIIIYQTRANDENLCQMDLSQIPTCSGVSLLVDKSVPAQVVQIQDLRHENIIQVLQSIENSPTKLSLPYTDNKSLLESFKNEPENLALIKKALANKKIVKESLGNMNPLSYIRDAVIYSFDPNKNAIIRISDPDDENEKFFSNQKNRQSLCGTRLINTTFTRPLQDNELDINSQRGGNIQALPGGAACLTSQRSPDSFVKEICGDKAKIVRIDTRFSRIGHVDEIMNIIPNKNNKCGFSVVMGSTSRGIEILKKNPNELFFSSQGNSLIDSSTGRTCHTDGICYRIKNFCNNFDAFNKLKKLQQTIKQNNSPNYNHDTKPGVSKLKLFLKMFNGDILLALYRVNEERETQIVDEVNNNYSVLKNALASSSNTKPCESATNKDVVDIMSSSEKFAELSSWLESNADYFKEKWKSHGCEEKLSPDCDYLKKTDFYKVQNLLETIKQVEIDNNNYQATQEKNWQIIKNNLPKNCQSDDIRLDLPSIYYDNHSLNPNPTNLETIGNGIAMPMQFNTSMDADYQSQIKSTGMKPIMINTFSMHEGGGNAHCRSNEVRICKPK